MQLGSADRPRCGHVVSSQAFSGSVRLTPASQKRNGIMGRALSRSFLIQLLRPLQLPPTPDERSQTPLHRSSDDPVLTGLLTQRADHPEDMSTFGYRRELSKYEDLDEDELLASLTAEELQELEKELADIDPDGNVPIGLRQRDQTVKTPTGTFSREALMKYWENETRKLLEEERIGSTSPGQVSDLQT